MQLFYFPYKASRILPYWLVKTDAEGDYIELGMSLEQLEIQVQNQTLLDLARSVAKSLKKEGRYLDRLYFSDLCPPQIVGENQLFQAFPYQDVFWDDEDEEAVKNWELQDPKGHSYARLYLKHNPEVLIGIVETIHYNTPGLIDNLHRCRLLGISYFYVQDEEHFDAGNYFVTRHLVVLRPGDEISFNVAFHHHLAFEDQPRLKLSYAQLLSALKHHRDE